MIASISRKMADAFTGVVMLGVWSFGILVGVVLFAHIAVIGGITVWNLLHH